MQEMVALNVISRPTSAITKLSAIVKICKYKRFNEGHHFIPMAMKVHDTHGHDMDCFIKECAPLFSTIDIQHAIYPCPFAFNF